MADFLKNTFKKIAERFKSLTKGQKTRLIVLVALVAAIVVAASVLLNQKSYDVLYSGMDTADAGEVLSMLTEMGVDAKTQGSDTILVESSRADSIRMQLAADGYPKSGYNFDIFKQASGLGATDMEKRVYYQFQLQSNIRDAILTIAKVKDAVVTLSIPEDNTFVLNTDETPTTAGVILTLKEDETLTNAEARAIAEIIAKSVSGLALENVRIIDSDMNLYDLNKNDDDFANVGDQLALQKAVQLSLKEQVVNLLSPIFGDKGILAEVNVTLNFDNETSESVVFQPPVEGSEEGLAVSMQELAETVKGEAAAGEVAGTESNGAGTTTYPSVDADEDSVYSKVTREANYELNETKTQIEKAKGRISGLSVSVILDSSTIEEDYTENVRNLVATAIGVDIERITVDRLPFLQLDSSSSDVSAALDAQRQLLEAANQAQLLKSLITAGTVIIVFLLLLAAIRTLTKPARSVKEIEAPEYAGEYVDEPVYYDESDEDLGETEELTGATVDYAIGEENELPPVAGKRKGRLSKKAAAEQAALEQAALEQAALEAAQVAQAAEEELIIPEIEIKKDTNLKQLENFIDKNPESVALLLRSWLSDER